jgi:hypothetical protein
MRGAPWRTIVAFALALAAQQALEPRDQRTWLVGVSLYAVAAIWLVAAASHAEFALPRPPLAALAAEPATFGESALTIAASLAVLTLLACGGNRLTLFNLAIWLATIGFLIRAFWTRAPRLPIRPRALWWLLAAAAALAVFFRVFEFGAVPGEMFSDHAEKLLDVGELLNGQTLIFFPRNTGREAFQMYLTAAIALVTGLNFTALRIGTVLAGLCTLPYIYLLGRELGSRRAGVWAMLLAGIGYWPNVISRVGLRFPLAPLFWAPAFYYLVRGLRTGRRNHFILAGLSVGLGLHGYTPFRVVPIAVVVAVALYLAHRVPAGARRRALIGLAVLSVVALSVFLPLLRYAIEHPDQVAYRTMTRLGSLERPLPGPAGEIFLSNLGHALAMFGWDDGDVWGHSVTHRPALDVVTGALFHLGVLLLLIRYIRRRHWLDLFLLLSIPLLMLPSILSLAFPGENPALNRTALAIVPVFLVAGLALETLVRAVRPRLGLALAGALVLWSATLNYDLVFRQYRSAYDQASWNTSEMGQAVRAFIATGGRVGNAWMVSYPYWADGRLVGICAGYPARDFSLMPEQLATTVTDPRAKLFLLQQDDRNGLQTLRRLYPQGTARLYPARVKTREFVVFSVLAAGGTTAN